jgi:hypothetical protein
MQPLSYEGCNLVIRIDRAPLNLSLCRNRKGVIAELGSDCVNTC